MFQTFEAPAQRGAATTRIKGLRRLMAAAKLDAYLIPRADEHQGEYVPPSAERLTLAHGLLGLGRPCDRRRRRRRCSSMGATRCRPAPRSSRDCSRSRSCRAGESREWLSGHLSRRAATVGFDPRLHTVGEIEAAHGRAQGRRYQADARLRAISSIACGAASARRRPSSPVSAASAEARGKVGARQDRRHAGRAQGRRA